MMEKHYRCWVEIDRSALRHNVAFVREKFGPDIDLLAVVKANAYGHGMIEVAQTIADQANIFGVANLEEATALRAAVQNPITILGPALPGERGTIAERGFIPSISALEEARDFDRIGRGQKVPINFKIDTGMGRMGVLAEEAVAVFKQVSALRNIKVHSVSTHLPVSNEDEHFTREELHNFGKLIKQLRLEVPGDYKAHALQTAGVLAFAEEPFEIVRPGMLIYGISSLPEFQSLLRPAMAWKTRIALIREIPAGHGISYGVEHDEVAGPEVDRLLDEVELDRHAEQRTGAGRDLDGAVGAPDDRRRVAAARDRELAPSLVRLQQRATHRAELAVRLRRRAASRAAR